MRIIHSIGRHRSGLFNLAPYTVGFIATGLALTALSFASPTASAAGRDRTKPTVPGNFRVTNKTPFSVSLAWSPSQDNSGNFTYLVWSTGGGSPVTLPKTATSHTFSPPFYPRNSYTFGIQAVDAAGNYSNPISISTVTPADTTPPSTSPVVSLTDVGSTYLSLSWTAAQDDGPFLFYRVAVNGIPYATGISSRSTTVRFLQPETSYDITVQASDYGNNASPASAPLTVTTEAPNPQDHTAPSTPSHLHEDHWGGGDTEIHVAWDQSTDDFDDPANLRYDVYVNGVFQDVLFGSGGPSIVYGDLGDNTIEVVATDTAGNASPPAVIQVSF
jgi:chitinase